MNDRDESLLDSTKVAGRCDSITERIERLKREIGKGEAVYTVAELRRLERQLEEYEGLYRNLLHR
ncbi:hypothetical protein GURASL_34240 [Geotalea uraniireducens]|uniref:Uncharacterized protein n=1 Tax=Geotalea uraniireducens TaxID=351604 RepID=A0ABN6VYU8_9BACT|nr:hypothetical protein [Geotalea uraniireducens]BDV44501.1 hypothetical protein GURASL_34240 [Geotalea uraniireducens]